MMFPGSYGQPSFQQNPIMGQLPSYGQMPSMGGGQQMQPLGMGQMPMNTGPMQGGQQNPYAQRFDPRMMSYGFGMGLLGQHMNPMMRPMMNAMGSLAMQRFGR